MSVLQGNAKKYSGAAIDYALIFDWSTGDCIGKAIPNAAGIWTFNYYTDLICGITYVASGCEPITHGPYTFVASNVIYGYIALAVASTKYMPFYDKNAINEPTWPDNFSKTLDIGLHNYVYNSGTAIAPQQTKIIDFFDVNWSVEARAYIGRAATDDILVTLELLDDNLSVLAAIKIAKYSNLSVAIYYGSSLNNLSLAPTSSSPNYTVAQGIITFTSNAIYYKNTWNTGGTWVSSFEFAANVSSARKIRVSSYAKSTSDGGATGYFKVLPPKPVQ